MGKLSRYSTWVALAVFASVILLYYQGLFLNNLSTTPNVLGWSMEYNWSTYVAEGVPLYPKESAFIEGQSLAYMPLYFLIVGNLMKVFGTNAVVGKVVSALAVLGTALLIYKMGVKLTGRKLLSMIPGVLFLLYPITVNYTSVQMKIEPLGLLLSTVSLYLVFSGKYTWAAPFAVLAFFTKQYFVAIPIATCVLLLLGDRKSLLKYLGLYTGLAVAGFVAGQYATEGTFFTHTILYLGTAPDFTTIVVNRNVVGTLVCLGYLTPVLLLAIYSMRRTKTFGYLGIYLAVSLAILGITIGKVGSGINYTFDALVASCCLTSLLLRRRDEVVETTTTSNPCPISTPRS